MVWGGIVNVLVDLKVPGTIIMFGAWHFLTRFVPGTHYYLITSQSFVFNLVST